MITNAKNIKQLIGLDFTPANHPGWYSYMMNNGEYVYCPESDMVDTMPMADLFKIQLPLYETCKALCDSGEANVIYVARLFYKAADEWIATRKTENVNRFWNLIHRKKHFVMPQP